MAGTTIRSDRVGRERKPKLLCHLWQGQSAIDVILNQSKTAHTGRRIQQTKEYTDSHDALWTESTLKGGGNLCEQRVTWGNSIHAA